MSERTSPISVAEARQWFSNAYGNKKSITNQNTLPNSVLDVVPVWAFAQTGTYLSNTQVVVCPIQKPGNAHPLSRFFLALYKDSSNQISARVIITRGINNYATNGIVMAQSNFSGTVASLNFAGNYSGPLHLVNNGVQVAEINPEVGDIYGNGTIVLYYSQILWWLTDNGGGGGWYFDGSDIWLNNTGNPGPFINNTFTPLVGPTPPGGSGGSGGGGSNIIPNTTNPLDFHLVNVYANPMFIISDYFENNNLEGAAYTSFGYLNSTERQILANFQNLIDPLHDFLVAHNQTGEAKTFVAELLIVAAQSNWATLSLAQINSLYDNLPGIEEAVIAPVNTPVSVANPICAEILTFKTQQNGVYPANQYAAMVLRNAYFQFNLAGGETVTLEVQNMRIDVEANLPNSDCLVSSPAFAANAINSAMSTIQQAVIGFPVGTPSPTIVNFIELNLSLNLNDVLLTQVQNCNSKYTSDIQFLAGMFDNSDNSPVVDCDAQIVNCQ